VAAQLPATGPFGNIQPSGTDFAPLDTGRRIGKYRLVYPVGEGGMSVVYLAEDEVLDRRVAIKILHRHLARDPEARARFSREARAVARLAHRNIPEIYDFSDSHSGVHNADGSRQNEGPSYLVTEYVDGAPLSRILREGPALLPELGVMLTLGVARALVHAHSQNVVHRDVKPENVLVGKDGVVKLTDFGIAQIRGLESMTMTGTLIGSPAHMAPEQIESAKDIDQRADIWGLGTVLYMAVTGGKLPFEADNPHRLLKKIVDGVYTDPRRLSPHVDSRLADIIAGCLVVDRERRYQTVSLVERELEAWLSARGFTDQEGELRRFMADPEGTSTLLATRLANVMMLLGEDASERGERSVALEHFGRVLMLDPERDDAMVQVRKLERQLRTRRSARWILVTTAATGATVAIAWVVYGLATQAPPPQPVPIAVSARALGRATLPDKPTMTPPSTAGVVFGDALGLERARFDAKLGTLSREAEAAAAETARREAEAKAKDERDRHVRIAVPVKLTVYPPAVRIEIDGKRLAPGTETALMPGKYHVTLTHTGCSECPPEQRVLVVPEPVGGVAKLYEQHFDFVRSPESLAPARFTVTCNDGSYMTDGNGRRFDCNITYTVPVTSEKAKLMQLTVFSAQGERRQTLQFNLLPNAPIIRAL